MSDIKYGDLVGDNQRKVPIPARVDLRDLYTALATVREVFGIPLRKHTKSGGIQSVAEALARMGVEQGFVDAEDVPRDMQEAAQKLELEASWTFQQKRQQRAIAEGGASQSPSLEQEKRGKEFRKKVEEEMEQKREKSVEEETERLKQLAKEQGNLVEEEKESASEIDSEKVFSQIAEIGSPATALIQLGRNEGWSDSQIAQQLQDIAERGSINDEEFEAKMKFFKQEESAST